MTDSPRLSSPFEHAFVAHLDGIAAKVETTCGSGTMIWRMWGSGEPLVLLHGGHGSWLHWVRNVEALAARFRVLVPDMPGFGSSADSPDRSDPSIVGSIVAEGIRQLAAQPVALAGFSFGGIIGGHVARLQPDLIERLILVGSSGMGLTRPPQDAMRSWRGLDFAGREAAHRHNLSVLMFGDPAKIDPLALLIQDWNTAQARGLSRPISRTTSLLDCLIHVPARLAGIWGERDATAVGHIHERRELLVRLDPASRVEVIERAGHWVQYEAPEWFNTTLPAMLDEMKQPRRS